MYVYIPNVLILAFELKLLQLQTFVAAGIKIALGPIKCAVCRAPVLQN